MQTLWLAIFLYSIGLGLVLHFRPSLMFNQNGSWKEFGYKRDTRYTMFPVWLFAIVWAVISYGIAVIVCTMTEAEPLPPMYRSPPPPPLMSEAEPYEFIPASSESFPEAEAETIPLVASETPRSRGRPRKQPRSGYYLLDPESEHVGLRKYIYYGNAPPPPDKAPTLYPF